MIRSALRTLLFASGLLATSAAGASAAAPTPSPVEPLARPSTIAAYGQYVAWSRYDTATGKYNLVAANIADSYAGVVLPIPPRDVAFDVDLGPDQSGNTVAVYSRCTTEPDGDYYGQKLYPNNVAGCDIYEYDFKLGVETKLNASSLVASEYLPTIWKGTVAFARSYGKYHPLNWRDSVLYTHTLFGTESSVRQSQGSAQTRDSITGLDLYGKRLALTRRFIDEYDGGTSQMRVTTLGSGSRLLEQKGSGLTQHIIRSPQFHHGRVFWLEQCAADESGCTSTSFSYWRSRIATNTLTSTEAPKWLASAARTFDTVFTVQTAPHFGFDNTNTCKANETGPDTVCELGRTFEASP